MTEADRRGSSWSVLAALVAVQVFFGLHYLATKLLLEEVPPRAWVWMRAAGATLLLLAAVRLAGRRLPRRAGDLGRLALFSVLGVVINQLCFVEGLHRTTPTHSSLINTTIPVGTLLFAVLLGHERLRPHKLAALVVAFGGLLLVVGPAAGAADGRMLAGDLLTLVNATSYALFLVLSKRLISRSDPLAATAVLLGFGTLGLLPLTLPALLALDLGAISATGWALALFIVVFPTAGAYLLTYWALARVESSVVAFFIYLQPLVATALSMALLGERPPAVVWLGALLIFAGVYLALRRGAEPAAVA